MIKQELIQRLFSYAARGKAKSSLAFMERIDDWQNHLHRRFQTIHVSGTNGKGSVANKIAEALRISGKRVGLYTSPHISTYRERIQVDGELISEAFVEEYLPKLFSFIDRENIQPSFFELLTALAFEYFAKSHVDVAVLEVGLGGQLDATNVVTPILSVITSIDFDHMEILGPTLYDIAESKAGIIKPGVPVVVGPRAQFAPILKAAGDRLLSVPAVSGYYDHENSVIARAALEFLCVPEHAIENGITVRPPCRFEIVDPRPIILDVAHNPDGFRHLADAIEWHYPGMKFHFAFAMGQKKNPICCIEKILSAAKMIHCVSNGHPRLSSAQDLYENLHRAGCPNLNYASTLTEVLQIKEPTVVCGSFFIMNDARRALKIRAPEDSLLLAPLRLPESTKTMELSLG